MKSKSIQVIPKPEFQPKVAPCAKKLGTSNAGLCVAALEFFLPLIEDGKWVMMNGKLVEAPNQQAAV